MKINFYNEDPNNGSEKIPLHKFLKLNNEENLINPTHNFDALKNYRLNQFELKKDEFIKERNFEEVSTTDSDINMLYELWLKNESQVINSWLSNIYPNGDEKKIKIKDSERIEITKYQSFIYQSLEEINLSSSSEIIDTSKDLPEIDLTTQKEQIRILYELGIIEHLQNKYKNSLKGSINQTANLISKFLKLERSSVQPTLNALLNDDAKNKNYPKMTQSVKSIIDKLYSNESI
jgi:hypothetical protein